jgi:exosortase/archaeosortase
MFVRPIISGLSLDFSNVFHYLLHVKYFWEFSIINNSLFWIFALICVGVAILMKDRSKSLWQTIISKEQRTASLVAVGLFTFITLAIVSEIYLPDIIYDYTHDQCLSHWWYCFDFLKKLF